MRHKVYCTISTYSKGVLIRETNQNSGRKKIDEVRIFVNADTQNYKDLRCKLWVQPLESEVSVAVLGGDKYVLDLTGFEGKIILNNKQLNEVITKAVADKLPHHE